MNIQVIQTLINKVKQEANELDREVTGAKVHTKEAITRIKEIRTTLTHLHNLLKLEESLETQKDK